MTHPMHPDFPGLHIMPVHVTNAHEIRHPDSGGQSSQAKGYARSTWQTFSAPLLGQGVTPVQLLKSDERRGRAVFFSITQDIIVASTEAELILAAGSASLAGGGYVPKLTEIVVYDGDALYAVSAATGATNVTVHAESTVC